MYIICCVCAVRSAVLYLLRARSLVGLAFFCAASAVLLLVVSVAHFSVSVAAKAAPDFVGESVAACSELCERRDRLHAEIERLHAETAMVEAELGALCTMQSNETDVGVRPLLTLPSQSPGGTTYQATGVQQTAQTAQRTALARRRGKGTQAYAAAGFVGGTVSLRPLHRAGHGRFGGFGQPRSATKNA
jgi:uncharacterized small protein (DUF1192 family)